MFKHAEQRTFPVSIIILGIKGERLLNSSLMSVGKGGYEAREVRISTSLLQHLESSSGYNMLLCLVTMATRSHSQ